MKKIFLALVAMLLFSTSAYASSFTTANVELDGVAQEYSGIIVDGATMLPIRDMAELFNLPLEWDNESKTATTCIMNLEYQLQANNAEYVITYADTGSSYTKELDNPPVIVDGRCYLPLNFFSDKLDTRLDWDNDSKTVNMFPPVKYEDGAWYTLGMLLTAWTPDYKLVDGENSTAIDDMWFTSVYVGDDGIMGSACMYALYPDGTFKVLLNVNDGFYDVAVEGDYVYVMYNFSAFSKENTIEKVDLNDSYKDTSFSDTNYTFGLGISSINGIYANTTVIPMEIQESGIYVVGFDTGAIVEGYVYDYELLESTYGYYLLDKESGEATLVQSLSLPE